ncbi:periplasmic heavy metal sensor [Parapedomonas caeni]
MKTLLQTFARTSVLALTLASVVAGPAGAETQDGPPPMGDRGPGGPGGPGGLGGPDPAMDRMIISRLSPAGRKILADSFRKGMPDEKERRALDTVREQILDLISAPRLDAKALDAAFMRERQLSTAMQTRRQQAMLDTFKKLSPADRQIFAKGLREIRPDMRKRMVRKEFRDMPTPPPYAE